MSLELTIGHYIINEPTRLSRCPSYYAADTETLELKPGRYELRLTFEGGYMIPMPYWLLARIDATRVEGRLYSGFGGVNFASTELPAGENVTYCFQTYSYVLSDLVKDGTVELLPGMELWLADLADIINMMTRDGITWDKLKEMGAVRTGTY